MKELTITDNPHVVRIMKRKNKTARQNVIIKVIDSDLDNPPDFVFSAYPSRTFHSQQRATSDINSTVVFSSKGLAMNIATIVIRFSIN